MAQWEQNKFEEVLSEHLKIEHDIKDEFYLEKEYLKAIKLRSVFKLIQYLYFIGRDYRFDSAILWMIRTI